MWAISGSGPSSGAFVPTPVGREQDVIAQFFGTDAAGKVVVSGGTKKYIEGRIDLVRGLTQAQMDEVVLILGVWALNGRGGRRVVGRRRRGRDGGRRF